MADATPAPVKSATRTLDIIEYVVARDRPVVTVCRAGGRSAQATVILLKAGFDTVANLGGGMLRWRAEGRVVMDGRS